MGVDLHVHTNASSDGDTTPKEVVKMAKEMGLEAIAITDHDSVESLEEGIYWGREYGVEVIPGIEFYTEEKGKWLHILGYLIDYNDEHIISHCERIKEDRTQSIDRQIALLQDAGYYLEKEKVLEDSDNPMYITYSKTIFADYRNQNNPSLQKYRNMDNAAIGFCKDWIIPGKPLCTPIFIPRAQDVITYILESGGVPILAHPGEMLTFQDDHYIDSLLEYGLEGLEVYTSWHNELQEEHYLNYCKNKGLIYTSGSDYHGKLKPQVSMGKVKNNTYDLVRVLKNKRKQLQFK